MTAFLIWALVAGSAVFWGLRLAARSPQAPLHTAAVSDMVAASGDLTRLFGSTPVVSAAAAIMPEAASRFRLVGVMAPPARTSATNPSAYGLALIAVDGKAPRPYPVGARLDGDLVLQSVSRRAASIGPAQGAASMTLELPPLAAPTTGSLPAISFGVAPPMAVPAPIPAPIPMLEASELNAPAGLVPQPQNNLSGSKAR